MQSSMDHQVLDVFSTLCEDSGTPYSLSMYMLAKYGEWAQLVTHEPRLSCYANAFDYGVDNSVFCFFKKCRGLPTGIDLKAKAHENFWKSERECYWSNERLSPYLFNAETCNERIQDFILGVKRRVREILGPVPAYLGRFGPGATFSDRGRLTTVPDKMSSVPTMTPNALYHLFDWSGTAWASACAVRGDTPISVRGNRFTTVPKDATKDRGICIEPSINVFYQLGLGRAIRRRLSKAGIDLLHGQEIHRRVVCDASITGAFSTIDLTNASDTICSNLVRLLLPSGWFDLLNQLRSPCTLVKDRWVHLEKFSSMGNGYTFELETLIFLCISAEAISRDGVSPFPGENLFVYGDDIICPTESYSSVVSALKFFGFTPNEKKSFSDGWFRESCGGDFFRGTPVRGYYLKEFPHDPHTYIAMANGIRRLGSKDGHLGDLSLHNRRAWFRSLDLIPSSIRRLRGPVALGDIVIHDHPEKWNTRVRHSIRYVKALSKSPKTYLSWKYFRPEVTLATALYGVGDGRLGVLPRNPRYDAIEAWVAFS